MIKIIQKKVIYSLLAFFILSIAGCKNKEPEVPELPPLIIVNGDNPLLTGIYTSFVDGGVKISDHFGIDTVWMGHNIDTSLLGKYQVFYHVLALSGMTAEAQRDVWVIVKPKSMKGLWNVTISDSDITFIDSLDFTDDNVIINNFNGMLEGKVELLLAADLQDSVYIFEQELSDSLHVVWGSGTIDKRAMKMILNYSIVEDNDTTVWNAVYSRDSISTK